MLDGLLNARHIGTQLVVPALHVIECLIGPGETIAQFFQFGFETALCRQLGLEEDSCREVSDIGHDRVYITDRLGMPLIEVVTEPEMVTPQETGRDRAVEVLLAHDLQLGGQVQRTARSRSR